MVGTAGPLDSSRRAAQASGGRGTGGLGTVMMPSWESIIATMLVVGAIASGWLLMWYCVLSQIGFVRSLFDLDDRDRKKAAERQKR